MPTEGIEYIHAPELGNAVLDACRAAGSLEPYRAHLAERMDALDRNLLPLLAQGRCVALLCGCANAAQCHRGVIADAVRGIAQREDWLVAQARGLPDEIEHLRPAPGEPKEGPRPRILGITLHQPWAFCVAYCGKRIENRSWKPWCTTGTYLAIHAGKKWDREGAEWVRDVFGRSIPNLPTKPMPTGIVAVAQLAGVVESSTDPWFAGPVGWLLENVVPLGEPIPCKGAQGLWKLDPVILAEVRVRWKAAVDGRPTMRG